MNYFIADAIRTTKMAPQVKQIQWNFSLHLRFVGDCKNEIFFWDFSNEWKCFTISRRPDVRLAFSWWRPHHSTKSLHRPSEMSKHEICMRSNFRRHFFHINYRLNGLHFQCHLLASHMTKSKNQKILSINSSRRQKPHNSLERKWPIRKWP